MTVKDIIESGIVESYVLGLLDATERAQFEVYLDQYPELQQELARVEQTIAQFAATHAVEPPPQLQEKIWNALQQHAPTDADPASVPSKRFSQRRWATIVGAAILLESAAIIAGGVVLLKFHTRLEQVEANLVSIQRDHHQTVVRLNQGLDDLRLLTRALGWKALAVTLKGTKQQPTARATLWWDKSSGELLLVTPILEPLNLQEQYQLWAIVRGKPVDAGVFSPDSLRLVYPMKPVASAEGFAVTIEPHGGSAVPTLSRMVLVGTLPSPRLTERGTR
jgi:anti-sigma-K factor RskA